MPIPLPFLHPARIALAAALIALLAGDANPASGGTTGDRVARMTRAGHGGFGLLAGRCCHERGCRGRSQGPSEPIAGTDPSATEPRSDPRTDTLVIEWTHTMAAVSAAMAWKDVGRFGACPLYLGLSRLLL